MEEKNLEELAAAMNVDMTDENGEMIEDDTSSSDSAAEETTEPEEASAPAEKPTESESKPAQADEDDEENTLAEDESGKKYIPKKRFDKVYAKMRELERLQAAAQGTPQQAETPQAQTTKANPQDANLSKLELELLYTQMPQFNPYHENYSEVLDRTAGDIWRANPGMTRLEAARVATQRARELSQAEVTTKVTARQIKAQQSDQGMTSRVASRQTSQPNPENMTLEEKERFLKENGMWDLK